MSDGPIKRERAAWAPKEVSTPENARVCKAVSNVAGYCGRTSTRRRSAHWDDVTCADCRAAARADGKDVPVEIGWKKGVA